MLGRLAAAAVLSFGLCGAGAAQQKFPSKTIEIIIPFSPGSGVDLIGRATATAISEILGQTAVVLNREGAAGTLGFGTVASAVPDGHMLAFGPSTPIANAPYLVKGVRYNAESFDYICQIFENVFTLSVGPQSKINSVQELLAAAKEKPGTVTYGSAGLGTIPYLSVENLADALKVKFQHVPFRGDAPVVPALLSGQIDAGSVGISSIRGNDRIRPLLVFADERHPAYPNVPVAKEIGVTTSVPPGHNGLYAPKGLPADVKASLERACAEALKHDALQRAINNTGMTVKHLTSAQFQAQTLADYKAKGELIQRLGLKTE